MERSWIWHSGHVPCGGPHGARKPLPEVELEVVRGKTIQRWRPLTVPAFLMGSATDCDLVLCQANFPEVFAYFMLRPGEVVLRHLGFRPELLLNGRPVTRAHLADQDLIQAGAFAFRVHIRFPEESVHAGQWPLTTAPASAWPKRDADGLEKQAVLLDAVKAEFSPSSISLRIFRCPEPSQAALGTPGGHR